MVRRLLLASLALAIPAHSQDVAKVEQPPADLKALPFATFGRAVPQPDGTILRQWPGTYFETGFVGRVAFFRIGPGEVSLRIGIDGQPPIALVKPEPGLYRVPASSPGAHRLRIDVASESQKAPTSFGGFFRSADTRPAAVPRKTRMIEFIGDSHTVGYGNLSLTRQCTVDEVWAMTDTSRGLAPLTAAHYDADYQVDAISGRGIVRNYNGTPANTLPQAYRYRLLDKSEPADEASWRPQIIVISLGTNDFSTPLHPGERWKTRAELHADYEATFVHFVQQLRALHPRAYLVFWATDLGGDEIQTEVKLVVDRLHRSGEKRAGFVPLNGLAFSGCNSHPSIADDRKIADALIATIDSQAEIWPRR